MLSIEMHTAIQWEVLMAQPRLEYIVEDNGSGPHGISNLMPASRTDCEVYIRSLIGRGHGYPLWRPMPWSGHPSAEYKARGTSIGDVGYVTYDGRFRFLFSATRPADHPFQCNGVPENFTPLVLPPTSIVEDERMHVNMSYIGSSHMLVRQAAIDAGVSSEVA